MYPKAEAQFVSGLSTGLEAKPRTRLEVASDTIHQSIRLLNDAIDAIEARLLPLTYPAIPQDTNMAQLNGKGDVQAIIPFAMAADDINVAASRIRSLTDRLGI